MANLTVTHSLAERHEALWLHICALHKDVAALAAKKPLAGVSDPVRIVAEGLLSDCVPFTRQRGRKLPIAAPDLSGLVVQLGQALAGLEAFESQHSGWDISFGCRAWQLETGMVPIRRLKPNAAPPDKPSKGTDMTVLRSKLARLIDVRQSHAYEDGFAAGRAARSGPPVPAQNAADEPEIDRTYPRVRAMV